MTNIQKEKKMRKGAFSQHYTHKPTHTDEWKVAVLGELPCVPVLSLHSLFTSLAFQSVTIHNVREHRARLESQGEDVINVTGVKRERH